ncbi:MAG: hypothetical protein ONB46_14895 [candidate division KSB1 bacterium]|nr:hypothetical protein [candidate division KSB1 bacterium]MDZ7367022.1 hypothetical protein [candidate division KSB1 bacterium]MDZ7406722.1 hypothetical protein [candidate division KSB1 bacterium]
MPRAKFGGKGRAQVLYEYVPDFRQRARDRAFLKRLKAQHERPSSRQAQPDPRSRELLDDAFTRFDLLPTDSNGSLRTFLSAFEPAAIKTAVVIFQARRERGKIQAPWAHRHLSKLIVAEKAAEGEVPVATAFWRKQLRALLINAKELFAIVRTHLKRMHGANFNLRLLLINELAELEYGLRAA